MIITRENIDEAMGMVCRQTLWKLKTGRINQINTDYHKKRVAIDYSNIDVPFEQLRPICRSAVMGVIDPDNFYFEDIISEAVYNFLCKCGEIGTVQQIWYTARYTAYHWLRRKWYQETLDYKEVLQ